MKNVNELTCFAAEYSPSPFKVYSAVRKMRFVHTSFCTLSHFDMWNL